MTHTETETKYIYRTGLIICILVVSKYQTTVPTRQFINTGKYTCTHFKSRLFVLMALTCECRHLIKTCSQVLSFITGRPAHSMILSPLVLGNSSPLHICDTAEHCRIYNISSYSREVLLYTQIWYFMTQVMW